MGNPAASWDVDLADLGPVPSLVVFQVNPAEMVMTTIRGILQQGCPEQQTLEAVEEVPFVQQPLPHPADLWAGGLQTGLALLAAAVAVTAADPWY